MMRRSTSIRGTVRRSQLITTYGVGSIVAVGDESVMVAGTDRWPDMRWDVHEPRLERLLSVSGFVQPPVEESDRTVPVVRFPLYCYCPVCRVLDIHDAMTDFEGNRCNQCGMSLVPSRFVVACSKGHIDDFPYFEWVHGNAEHAESEEHVLHIEAGGVSAALRDIVIKCSCGMSATMEGAFGREALRHVRRCTGWRPWLGDSVPCDEIPRTLQRGASNVYFANVRSALSIPPWSEAVAKAVSYHWTTLKYVPESALEGVLEGIRQERRLPFSVADLVWAVRHRRETEGADAPALDDVTIRAQEYEALVRAKPETSREQDFVCVPAHIDQRTRAWFERVMLVKRLREVRALESFTRLLPFSPGDPRDRRAPLARGHQPWLPAIEVLGEGVFLHLDAERLREWEQRVNVAARAERINHNYAARFAAYGAPPDRVISPRFVLIHTLAHALISQWALAAGYPAASLRERLYVSDETMAGLLIYTATSDAAGSLGGVVAQAEGSRLWDTIEQATWRASWCSSDPLCVEADAAGVDALNLAACHACVLLPEVSCEESNLLLDRAMLVGTPSDPSLGFFAALLSGE